MFRVPEKNANYTSNDKKVSQELILLSKIFFWGRRNYLLKELKGIFLAEGISGVFNMPENKGKKFENTIGNEKYGTLF